MSQVEIPTENIINTWKFGCKSFPVEMEHFFHYCLSKLCTLKWQFFWITFTHRAKMDELRMFLENEGWELCPVKSSFHVQNLVVSCICYSSWLFYSSHHIQHFDPFIIFFCLILWMSFPDTALCLIGDFSLLMMKSLRLLHLHIFSSLSFLDTMVQIFFWTSGLYIDRSASQKWRLVHVLFHTLLQAHMSLSTSYFSLKMNK